MKGITYYYDKETGTFVERLPEKKPDVHMVIPDEMKPTEYMGSPNREVFVSRSAYKRRLRQDGYEVTGGDHLTHKETPLPRPSVDDIRNDTEKAYMDIKYDRVPISEKERELCRQEARAEQAWKERNFKR